MFGINELVDVFSAGTRLCSILPHNSVDSNQQNINRSSCKMPLVEAGNLDMDTSACVLDLSQHSWIKGTLLEMYMTGQRDCMKAHEESPPWLVFHRTLPPCVRGMKHAARFNGVASRVTLRHRIIIQCPESTNSFVLTYFFESLLFLGH